MWLIELGKPVGDVFSQRLVSRVRPGQNSESASLNQCMQPSLMKQAFGVGDVRSRTILSQGGGYDSEINVPVEKARGGDVAHGK